MEHALVSQLVSGLLDTQHNVIAYHFYFYINVVILSTDVNRLVWRESSIGSNLLSTIQSIVAIYGSLRGRLDNLDFAKIYFQS